MRVLIEGEGVAGERDESPVPLYFNGASEMKGKGKSS